MTSVGCVSMEVVVVDAYVIIRVVGGDGDLEGGGEESEVCGGGGETELING